MPDKKKPVIMYQIAGRILILVKGKQSSVAQFIQNKPGMAASAKCGINNLCSCKQVQSLNAF
jgi:hypothetical protein